MGGFATYEGMYPDSSTKYLELAGLWEVNLVLGQAKIWILQQKKLIFTGKSDLVRYWNLFHPMLKSLIRASWVPVACQSRDNSGCHSMSGLSASLKAE